MKSSIAQTAPGSLRVSVGQSLIVFLFLSAWPASGQGIPGEGFPIGNYTPFGYLDNPYHTLWLNNSGVIRTAPPLGFRFRQHETVHQMAVTVNGTSYAGSEDFRDAGLHSAYHSKNLFTYDWTVDGVEFTAAYFLESDSARGLNVEVTMRNAGGSPADVMLRAALFLPPFDLDSYTARVLEDGSVIVQRYAAGPVYLLYPESAEGYFAVSDSASAVEAFLATGDTTALSDWDSDVTANFMGAVMAFDAVLEPRSEKRYRWVLARDVARPLVECVARYALATFDARRAALIQDDLEFWEDVPRLTGDWPDVWKNGLVYDWETLRMNVRRPIGRYRHHWDGMQVRIPRSVLAETAIDMFAYSYAQPETAREVLYGLFADALAPNVPCMREDGSVNMVSESGEESGTAPSWCLPSLALRSIYARTGDDEWASDLYPYLEEFVSWWLDHRTNPDSTMFFDNSWESGQDESSRFLVDHETGGTGVRHMEPVDLHASMADFADLLDRWADQLNLTEQRDWRALNNHYSAVTQSHWFGERFRDFDRRTDEYTDPVIDYHWMPFVFDMTATTQDDAFRSFIRQDTSGRFSGPSGGAPNIQITAEALWQVGERALLARLISETLDHVYTQWDRRTWETPDVLPRVWGHVDRPSVLLEYHPRTWKPTAGRIDNATNPGAPPRPDFVPMPGVASEFWRDPQGRPVGMENYGWGATMPMHLIRGIIGYRELPPGSPPGFMLAPSIPEHLAVEGHELGMANLHFRNQDLDVVYRVEGNHRLETILTWRSPRPVGVEVVHNESILVATNTRSTSGILRFNLANYDDVEIRIAE